MYYVENYSLPPDTLVATLTLTPDNFLNSIYNNIYHEVNRGKQLKAKNNNAWNFFHKLLDYNKPAITPDSKSNIMELSIMKADNLTNLTGWIVRDHSIHPLSETFHLYKELPEQMSSNCILNDTTDGEVAFSNIIFDYYNYIKLINDMIETYNTKELIDNNKNVFAMIKKSK